MGMTSAALPAETDRNHERRSREAHFHQLIGARIKQARTERGLTQEQLGNKVFLSLQMVERHERGAAKISVGRLLLFAKALDKSLLFFVRDIEEARGQEAETAEALRLSLPMSVEGITVALDYEAITNPSDKDFIRKMIMFSASDHSKE